MENKTTIKNLDTVEISYNRYKQYRQQSLVIQSVHFSGRTKWHLKGLGIIAWRNSLVPYCSGPARAIMLQQLCGHMRFLEHGLGLSLCCYDFCVSLRRDNLGSRAVSAKRSESSTNRGIIAVSDFRTFQSKLKVDCVPGNFIAVALPTCWDKERKTSVLQGRVALGQSASPVCRVGRAVAKRDFVI